MPKRVVRKPIPKDRRRRKWHRTDPPYARYPDTTRPTSKHMPRPNRRLAHPQEEQEGPDTNMMDDSVIKEQAGPGTMIPSLQDQQEHERCQNVSRMEGPRESRYSFTRIKQKFSASRDEPIPHTSPASTRSATGSYASSLASPSQQRVTPQTPVALSYSQSRDTCQPEHYGRPSQHTDPQLIAAYDAKLGKIEASHRQEVKAITQELVAVYDAKLAKMEASHQQEVKAITRERDENRQLINHLDSEIAARDMQIRELKRTISKSRSGDPCFVSDTQISSDYQYLTDQLMNWTLSNFRESEPTVTEPIVTDFGINPDTHPRTFSAANKCLADNGSRMFLAIEMLVMQYLVDRIFEPFLFGLDKTEEGVFHTLEDSFAKTSTQKEFHFWRSATIKMMISTKSHKHKVNQCKQETVAAIESILYHILSPSASSANADRRVEVLKKIVDQAVDLSFTLKVQRPVYLMHYLGPGLEFYDRIMNPVEDNEGYNKDNSDGLGSGAEGRRLKKSVGKVELTIVPALVKRGDVDGEGYDKSFCIQKGKALKA